MFENKPYSELKKIVDKENLMNLPVINQLDGWEGKVKLRIPIKLLKQILMVNATLNNAIKDLKIQENLQEYESSYYRYGLIRQIHNQLGYATWEKARKMVVAGEALLVCAYEEDETFNRMRLEGAIPLSAFKERLDKIIKNQWIIFYCA